MSRPFMQPPAADDREPVVGARGGDPSRLPLRPGRSMSRRQALQVGFSTALGAGLGSIQAARALAESTSDAGPTGKRAKGVLLVFLTGAPSHVDTFDMKPQAPAEVRGEFEPIATTTPGVVLCEHLPRIASRMDRLAIVRTMTIDQSLAAHETGTHAILTGIDQLPVGSGLAASRQDWPCYAAGLSFAQPRDDGLARGVHVADYLAISGSGFCGQNAGFLGPSHDPWQARQNLNSRAASADDSLSLRSDLPLTRIANRRGLLTEFDRVREAPEGATDPLAAHRLRAFDLLQSGRLANAFSWQQESVATQDRYGRHPFGKCLLMARRVLEAGVPLVQANIGVAAQWDTHMNNCSQLKKSLLPPFDAALSALLDDMQASGLLDETLVIVTGEFGRTPKLGGNIGTPSFSPDGRDHWTQCFSSLFAGAGVQGGQVVGTSDQIAAFPVTRPWRPSDLGATVYRALGVPSDVVIHDALRRPMALNSGEPIDPLFTGA